MAMTDRAHDPIPTTPLLTYEQLATWLSDSVRHLRRLVDEDRIPYHKVGHFIRFDTHEINDWLSGNHRGQVIGQEAGPMLARKRAPYVGPRLP